MLNYIPKFFDKPEIINQDSAWSTAAPIVKDIINRFNLKTNIALEFGVGGGYSAFVLSNYFNHVIGVDIDISAVTFSKKNIEIICMAYEDFIKENNNQYDLIHIDLSHTYDQTYHAGMWALKHSNCVLFHDTLINAVMEAVFKLVNDVGDFEFYNYIDPCGLGIVSKK